MIVWSGLRGAVGVAMAIIVKIEPDIPELVGIQVMFHVGGIAALTTLLNATTCTSLLKWLKITRTDKMKKRMLTRLHDGLSQKLRAELSTHIEHPSDIRFQGADFGIVRQMVPLLSQEGGEASARDDEPDDADDAAGDEGRASLKLYREVFLRVVQHHYWQAIQDGIIPRNSVTAQWLLESASASLGNLRDPLAD